jgi:hypothetical protein
VGHPEAIHETGFWELSARFWMCGLLAETMPIVDLKSPFAHNHAAMRGMPPVYTNFTHEV